MGTPGSKLKPPNNRSHTWPGRRLLFGSTTVLIIVLMVQTIVGPDASAGEAAPWLDVAVTCGWAAAATGGVVAIALDLSAGSYWGPTVCVGPLAVVTLARFLWSGPLTFLVLLWLAVLLAWSLWLGFTGLGRRCRWRLSWWLQLAVVPLLAAAALLAALNDGGVYVRSLVYRAQMNRAAATASTVPMRPPAFYLIDTGKETCSDGFCYSYAYRQGQYVTIWYSDPDGSDGLLHGLVQAPQRPGTEYFDVALPKGTLVDLRDLGGDWFYWAFHCSP